MGSPHAVNGLAREGQHRNMSELSSRNGGLDSRSKDGCLQGISL